MLLQRLYRSSVFEGTRVSTESLHGALRAHVIDHRNMHLPRRLERQYPRFKDSGHDQQQILPLDALSLVSCGCQLLRLFREHVARMWKHEPALPLPLGYICPTW